MPGGADLLVAARTVLLDALEALADHREALVLVGAQAVYLHTGDAPVALAEATKDSDLAIDPRILDDEPLLDRVMRSAGFHLDVSRPQPGSWLSRSGVPVDLMVPEALAGPGKRGRRGARIPPHDNAATRRTPGLEAAVVDHAPMTVTALDPSDVRSIEVAVAGPAALLVSKLHKLAERVDDPGRLVDKDAHDVYRLLVATDTASLAVTLANLIADELAGSVTSAAVEHLAEFFGRPDALGATMAGRAEELVGDPAVVAAAVALLADDVLAALERSR
ncbi:GSU2403 family nucleotidyltransferase fold protein [Patulibacter minatonensis]|uniref:GSU2403 family nucleotidyltransferase fold protein n=1 Tax=Patulibacter minatonensis TaxID=298163 RepID=UPI000478F06B|nr:GSU2403 family nucleotidyltransferase fold protein [Patulibacter minatonensis]